MIINYTGDSTEQKYYNRSNYPSYNTIKDGYSLEHYESSPKIKVEYKEIKDNKVVLKITQPVYIFPEKAQKEDYLYTTSYEPQYLGLWSKLKSFNPVLNYNSKEALKIDYIKTNQPPIYPSTKDTTPVCSDSICFSSCTFSNGSYRYYDHFDISNLRLYLGQGFDEFNNLFVSPLIASNPTTDFCPSKLNETIGWFVGGYFNYNNLQNGNEGLIDWNSSWYRNPRIFLDEGDPKYSCAYKKGKTYSKRNNVFDGQIAIQDIAESGYESSADRRYQNMFQFQQFICFNQEMLGIQSGGTLSNVNGNEQINHTYILTRSITEKPIHLYTGYKDFDESDQIEINFRHRTLSPITRSFLFNKTHAYMTSAPNLKYHYFEGYNYLMENSFGKGNNDKRYDEIISKKMDDIVNITDVKTLSDTELEYDDGKIISAKNVVTIDKTDDFGNNNKYANAYPQNDGFIPIKNENGNFTFTPIGLFDNVNGFPTNGKNNVNKRRLIPGYTQYGYNRNYNNSLIGGGGNVYNEFYNYVRVPQASQITKKYNSPYCWYTSTVDLGNIGAITDPIKQFSINGSNQFKNICDDNDVIYPSNGNVFEDLFEPNNKKSVEFGTASSKDDVVTKWFENVYSYVEIKRDTDSQYHKIKILTNNEYNENKHKIVPSTIYNQILDPKKCKIIKDTIEIANNKIQLYTLPTEIMDVYSVYDSDQFDYIFDTAIWTMRESSDVLMPHFNKHNHYWGNNNNHAKYKQCVKTLLNLNQSFDKDTCACDSLNELRESIISGFYSDPDSLAEFKDAISSEIKNILTDKDIEKSSQGLTIPYKLTHYTTNQTIVDKLISYYRCEKNNQINYPAKYCFSYLDTKKMDDNIDDNIPDIFENAIKSIPLYGSYMGIYNNTTPFYWRYSFICVPITYEVEVEFNTLKNTYLKYTNNNEDKIEIIGEVLITDNNKIYKNFLTEPVGNLFEFLNDANNDAFITDDNENDLQINKSNLFNNTDYINKHLKIKFLSNESLTKESVELSDYTEDLPNNCYTITIDSNANKSININYNAKEMNDWINNNSNVSYLQQRIEDKLKNPVAVIVLDTVKLKLDNEKYKSGNSITKTTI